MSCQTQLTHITLIPHLVYAVREVLFIDERIERKLLSEII